MESACECTESKGYLSSRLTVQAVDVTNLFRRLRLWREAEPVIVPVIVPPKPLPPLPMITYDKGLPSLPDDVIYEIFDLLDKRSLKSCSLAGKAISRPAKLFLHRTLYLVPRGVAPVGPPIKGLNTPGDWNEFKGLPLLGERGLLQHTRHLSVFLRRNPLFHHDLQLHVRHLHTLTNLSSLHSRWLDTPSFLPKMGEYFGAFLGSLRSLELEYPRGDHKQILYFICQFKNLQDLKIKGTQDYTHSMRNGGPHFNIDTFPALNGTLDLELYTTGDKGGMLLVNHLTTLPLKFRTLRLLGCTGAHSQLLIDACAPKLELLDLALHWVGRSFRH